MSTTTLKLRCFEGNRDDESECLCRAEVDIRIDITPPDPNYGADRDGNRGIYVGGSVELDDSAPLKCPECGYVYTDDERKQIERDWQEQLDNWSFD